MYKELEKYRTGNRVPVKCNLHTADGIQEITVNQNEYIAELGDLLSDFIEHKTKPFWRRKYYHSHLTKLYLQMLNNISITHSW